jgi:hypothetical protein
MPEVKIRYKNARTLKALRGIAKYFDFELEEDIKSVSKKRAASIPISYARNPDFKALAGIWKDKNITLDELRQKGWGERS